MCVLMGRAGIEKMYKTMYTSVTLYKKNVERDTQNKRQKLYGFQIIIIVKIYFHAFFITNLEMVFSLTTII